jgi:predicted phage terminase large subunit-like protein
MKASDLSDAAQRHLVDELLRRDLVSFIRRTFETVAPGEKLQLNWHIRAIAFALERVRRGEIKRLIITIPPRHLKSIATSVAFPAFVLGHDPTRKIVCVSYAHELAVKHAIDCRTVLRADWFQRLFPGTRIGSDKNTELESLTTKRGGRFATSVGGTLTGRGGNLIILDDPMKPDEAMSEISRKRVVQWFETTLLSRINMKAEDAIIIVMQRLHVDDLVGILLEKGGWEHLDIPAIADAPQEIPISPDETHHRDPGDVLDPVREPQLVLDELKSAMGSMAFSAQYQQRPVPAAGNLIRREWLKFYEHSPAPQPGDLLLISWDTAMTATELADYSVGTVWLAKGQTCYLLDLIRGRFDYPTLKRSVLHVREKWPNATILVEDKGSGTSLIQDLRHANVSVVQIKPEHDKVTRVFATQSLFEGGSVMFPRHAAWLDDLVAELLAFPHYRNDDQVDSISQALTWITRRQRQMASINIGLPISIPNPYPFLIGQDW